MKKIEWKMNEDFVFPTAAGMPTGAEMLRVTPRYTVNRTEDAVRLTGIYHISANITLDQEVDRTEDNETAILIDDVDLEGEAGYFEYAVPFNIDLPPEVEDPLKVVAENPACELSGQGCFAIVWDVNCTYQGQKLPEKEAHEEKEKVEVVKEEDSEQAKQVEESKEEKVEKEKVEKKEERIESKQEAKKEETKVEEKEANATAAVKAEQVQKVEDPVVEIEENKEVTTAVAKVEDVTFSNEDEAISFIAELEDGISVTLFRSNDVTVQGES